MEAEVVTYKYQFMAGGGEMGALTRAKDWSKTPLGSPDTWPQSLRTTLGILLNSKFPMFLWWGPELICFYNDAYRPSLGQEGKHPSILGQKAEDAWAEIWHIIKPLIDQVLAGGDATWSEDQLIPIYRNGQMEDVYWTFSYSPVNDESGKPRGVLVVCYETTGKINMLNDIRESKEQHVIALQKTEEAEQRLRLALDATSLATWDLELGTDVLFYTPRLAEIFGHDGSAILTHAEILNQLHRDDRHVISAAFERAKVTGIYYYEVRIVKPNRTISWIQTRGKVLFDEAKKPLKLIGTLRDITEERMHQQELLEREEKFRLLADSMPQFVWTSDMEGNLNYFNKSVYDYSGLTPKQIEKDGWLQIVHPDDREENTRRWMDSIATGKDFLFEHRFRRYDGLYRWQLSRATAQRDSKGNIQMWVGTSTDIEEQKMLAHQLETQVHEQTKQLKRSGDELVKRDELYQLMIGEVQDYAILFISREGIIENWNKGAEKIKGYAANEIIGKSFSLFYTREDKESHLPEKLLNEALKTGKATQEGWRVRKDGKNFWASVVITALHDQDGNIVGFSKVTRDLSEKKAAEERIKAHAIQLERKNNELEKMNTELKSFAYVSSHDLQEPLRKIQTFASLINDREHSALSEKGRDYFKRMKDAANRMQTLIEDLLAYSRTNSSERVFIHTDMNVLVTGVIEEFRDSLNEKNGTIALGPMCKMDIIPFQFRQLMQNLIGNALKFAKPGIPPHIQITAKTVNGTDLNIKVPNDGKQYCHIAISDNGIGFDPVYKDRVFEVFQRLHGKDEYKGTGIGLAIVKRIVENHNGVITAESRIGIGTTFDIYIPFM